MPVTATLLAGAAMLLGGDRIEVRRADLRVGDVLRPEALPSPVRSVLAGRRIATLPAGGVLTLRRTALARLIRRAVPGLDVTAGRGVVTIVRSRDEARTRDMSCRTLNQPVASGDVLRPGMLVPSDCAATPATRLDFDPAAGIVRATRALAAGTSVGRLALPEPAAVRAGDRLLLTSMSGPVRIERPVTAFQSARAGGRVFVRAGEGSAFAVPLPRNEGPRP